MPTKNPEAELMATVLDQMTVAGIATMSREGQSEYLSAMMMIGFQLLRSVEGDTFVRGLLDGATRALEQPPELTITRSH